MSTRRLGIGCGDGAEDHGDGELKKVVKVKSRVMEEEEETKAYTYIHIKCVPHGSIAHKLNEYLRSTTANVVFVCSKYMAN
ncbi:hypothetical protein Bca101_005677 [Brassica carinata]